MEHDYYQILGVPQAASPNDIRNAYRRMAMQNHPDRGGSHAAMLLVQEAWEVLSDDGRRARYDAARTAASGVTSRKAAAQDAREARWRAEQYPRGWAEMEAVLNRVAADFTGAEYGSVNLGHDFRFPTAGKSVSGWVFILGGAILGGVLVSPVVSNVVAGVVANAPKGPLTGLFGLVAVALPVLGGGVRRGRRPQVGRGHAQGRPTRPLSEPSERVGAGVGRRAVPGLRDEGRRFALTGAFGRGGRPGDRGRCPFAGFGGTPHRRV